MREKGEGGEVMRCSHSQFCFFGGVGGLKLNSAVYVGGSFGPWMSVWVFPQAEGVFPGCALNV